MAKAKHWCFTINNWTIDDEVLLETMVSQQSSYLCWAPEVAPSTGTHHLQGYVQFSRAKTLSQVKAIHGTAHWEMARGTSQQNKAYCQGPWESGDKSKPLNPYFKEIGHMDPFESPAEFYRHLTLEIDRRAITSLD